MRVGDFLLIFLLSHSSECCRWPSSDVLFIVDTTLHIQPYDFQKELDFVANSIEQMELSPMGSRVSLALFTPMGRFVFPFSDQNDPRDLKSRIQSTTYSPCDPNTSPSRCQPCASVNSIAKFGLAQGNRKPFPDVIVVISGGKYQIPELLNKEVLLSPISPIHAFYILVDGTYPDVAGQHYDATANTLKMTARDFDSLSRLSLPLCQSARDFVNRSNASHPMAFGSLCWIITSLLFIVFLLVCCCLLYAVYVYREDNKRLKYEYAEVERNLRKQNEYFTARIHKQMEDQLKLNEKHQDEVRRTQNELKAAKEQEKVRTEAAAKTAAVELAAAKNRDQPQPIIIYGQPLMESRDGQKTRDTTSRDSNGNRKRPNSRWRMRFDPRFDRHMTPDIEEFRKWWRDPHSKLPQTFRDWWTDHPHLHNPRLIHSARNSRDGKDGVGDEKGEEKEEKEEKEEEKPDPEKEAKEARRKEREEKRKRWEEWKEKQMQNGSWKPGEYERLRKEIDDNGSQNSRPSTDSDYSIPVGHLSRDHPSRSLPPVDILFLVDTSSSIGIQNFEKMKAGVNAIIEDVDVAPGRSRVAVVQFSAEPQVVFGFDKFFTTQSVQRAINRIIYTGGPTHLSKALSFTAGVLYKEQNMADGKHRRHKLAKTPRHDRLQVLCVASDGSSEDNVAKSTSMLHERLQIKVCALVTRAFHREKLEEITRFDGAIFVIDQKEAVNIWLWRQQRLWADTYSKYLEREKSMPLSTKKKPQEDVEDR